jgi:Ca2+-binding RTX toxin-like protein
VVGTLTQTEGAALIPYAGLTLNGSAFTIEDNVAQLAGAAPVTVPGEPAHAITEVVASALADGTHAAVAWADSGTDYVALFDAASDSFGPVIGLDWGGASDLHLVALPDGGFVASWINGGAYRGEVFAADGTGGGVIPLAGAVTGVTSSGALYTLDSHFQGQQYQIDPGQVVSTSAADYTAPHGVRTVFLTGSGQTVTGNDQGDVFWSNNAGNRLLGGAGNDTFYLGRGGDTATGNGGADVFKFSEVPWAGGHITDFAAGDALDLTLMLTTVSPPSEAISAGYLKLTDDGSGDAQVWANYHRPDNDVWWLVTTLDGVSVSSLHYANGVIT